MKIRNRKNVITSMSEGQPPPQPRQKFTQWIYFSVVLFTLGSVIYLIVDYNIHFFGSGRIEVDKTTISANSAGTINALHVDAGTQLIQGQPIATITTSRQCGKQNNGANEKLRYEIALKESRLRLLRSDLNTLRESDRQFIVRRALEIGNSDASTWASSGKEQRKLAQAVELLKSELKIQRQQLHNAEQEALQVLPAELCGNDIITTPFAAKVFMLKRRNGEYVNKGDPLAVLIGNHSTVHINVQFEAKSQRHLKHGDVLDVELADGWSTQGVVSNIFSATPENDKKFLNKDPETHKLWALLTPLDEHSKQRWIDNDLMGVNIRGNK